MNNTLVVVSHYNAWPTDQLVALLDQIKAIPAGCPFDCRVVVNQAKPGPLELPPRHADVEVLYRENIGYNIGAWDHGWRVGPPRESYLFLQEECRILRPGWLSPFVQAAGQPGVGFVGESLKYRGYGWDRVAWVTRGKPYPDDDREGLPLEFTEGIKRFLESRGLAVNGRADHLQSLVLCARREVLEAVDGFPIGRTKGDAIGCEVAISLRSVAQGYRIKQVGRTPFTYILHPQWQFLQSGMTGLAFHWVKRIVPLPLLPALVGCSNLVVRWKSRRARSG